MSLEVLDPRESLRARGFPRAQRTSAALDSRLVEIESVASRPPRKRNATGGGGGKRSRCGTPTPAQTPPRLCEDGSRASLSVSPRNFFDENLKSEASSTRLPCRNLWLQLRALLRGSPRPPGWGRPVRAGGTGRRPAAGPAPRLTRVCFSSGLKKKKVFN